MTSDPAFDTTKRDSANPGDSGAGGKGSDLVERVARAIQEDMDPGASWEHMRELRREDFRGYARAAIAAMREPTEEMLVAADRVGFRVHDRGDPYRAMIDAALGEDGE